MHSKIVIERKTLLYILMLFFIATPGYFRGENGTAMDYFLLVGEFVTYFFILLVWLHKKLSSFLVLAILMYGTIILSTYLNGGNVLLAIRIEVRYIFMIMLIDNEGKKIDCLWKACVIYLTIMVVINAIAILLFPNGIKYAYDGSLMQGQTQWFFDSKNGLGKYLLCLLYFKSDMDFRNLGKLSKGFYVIAFICVASVIVIWSATSIVTVCMMIILIVFAGLIKEKKYKLFNIYLSLGIVAGFFILFILFQQASMFGYFLTEILKKNITFNGRTPIWANSIARLMEKPILGYGYLNSSGFRALIGRSAASDAHNYFLTLGIYGGFVAIVLFLLILILAMKAIRRRQYEFSGITLTAFSFSFFLTMLFENTSMRLYWFVLAYAVYMGVEPEKRKHRMVIRRHLRSH